jgi:hypothetical protein
MSAQTRHDIGVEEQLEIVHLMHNCHDLIRNGNRSPQMVSVLRQAIQFFKENKLGGVVSLELKTAPEQVLDLFSLKVADSGMPTHCQHYLEQRGVFYIGEIFRIKWDRPHRHRKGIEQFLKSFGLALDSSTIDVLNWIPPYANDPAITDLWDQPIMNAIVDPARRNDILTFAAYYGAVRFGGQVSLAHRWSPGRMQQVQMDLGRGCKLHAGMVVRNWNPPSDNS